MMQIFRARLSLKPVVKIAARIGAIFFFKSGKTQ